MTDTARMATATAPGRPTRLVMNYYTAKRLWMGLGATLKRQETMFGVLVTDVTKRVVPQVQPHPSR